MEFYEDNLKLETEHLILRPLSLQDEEGIFTNICHDREVLKYYLDRYAETPADMKFDQQVKHRKERGIYDLAIILKETGETIGRINQCSTPNIFMNSIEIGYAVGRRYWNRGYATEALKAFTDLLFKKGIHKVFCGFITENSASKRVMEKAGMTYEGMRVQELHYRDRYWDVIYYYKINPYI